ncbi:Protein lin-9 [Orchesella cincta]|uniref:Protein lin-9 n=1 Tax=Orchesella cincta TaxID=48709 RepID=A0A1D2MC05_ORCCI|nr:Protein lin-9 [Orchesella cincta]
MAEQARSAKEWDNDEEQKFELSAADMEKVDRRRTSSTAKKAVATQPQQQTVEIVVMNPPLKSKQQQVAKRSCPARFKQNLPILNAVQQQELIAENYNQRHGGLMDLSHRVRNFLKLPKSHKWVCYEWFYSTSINVSPGVLSRSEDPKTTRIEWTTIRRIMGKPRRCSSAFLTEERLELLLKRQKIREIQQRKLSDFNQKELRTRSLSSSSSERRISFQRSGVGVHSVRDFEVSSNEPVETVSTSSFVLKIPRRLVGEKLTVGNFKFQNPALLALKPEGFPESQFDPTAMLGGFPIRLLDMIVQLSKLLKKKRIKIAELRELNVEAEKMTSYGKPYNQAFKLEYARDMGELNKVIGKYMAGAGTLSSGRKHDVSNFNDNKTAPGVKNPKILELIRNAATMMLGIRANSVTDKSPFE